VTRPFLFIQCQYASKLTETGLKKLIKEGMQEGMLFLDADGKQDS